MYTRNSVKNIKNILMTVSSYIHRGQLNATFFFSFSFFFSDLTLIQFSSEKAHWFDFNFCVMALQFLTRLFMSAKNTVIIHSFTPVHVYYLFQTEFIFIHYKWPDVS